MPKNTYETDLVKNQNIVIETVTFSPRLMCICICVGIRIRVINFDYSELHGINHPVASVESKLDLQLE